MEEDEIDVVYAERNVLQEEATTVQAETITVDRFRQRFIGKNQKIKLSMYIHVSIYFCFLRKTWNITAVRQSLDKKTGKKEMCKLKNYSRQIPQTCISGFFKGKI